MHSCINCGIKTWFKKQFSCGASTASKNPLFWPSETRTLFPRDFLEQLDLQRSWFESLSPWWTMHRPRMTSLRSVGCPQHLSQDQSRVGGKRLNRWKISELSTYFSSPALQPPSFHSSDLLMDDLWFTGPLVNPKSLHTALLHLLKLEASSALYS